jgi:hypothetical protein
MISVLGGRGGTLSSGGVVAGCYSGGNGVQPCPTPGSLGVGGNAGFSVGGGGGGGFYGGKLSLYLFLFLFLTIVLLDRRWRF